MPTTGRLTAAIALAALGFYIAYLAVPEFEEGRVPGYWYPLCIGLGAICGWIVIGSRSNRGYSAAVGNGLTGMAALVFWIVFIVSFMDMIQKSLRRSYDGPVEAVIGVFQLSLELAMDLYTNDIGIALVVGGIAAGLFSEFWAKRFP